MKLGWLRWRAWAGVGRGDAAAVGVAGVALGDIHLRFTWQALLFGDIVSSTFAWQAWHVWHWAGSYGTPGPEWNAGTPRLLAWQAWHLETSTFVSRGRRGYLVTSTSTFAWQAWHVWHWAGSDGTPGPEWDVGTPRLLAWQAWHLETSTFVSRGRRGAW